jgi:hypothetical protein
MAENITVKTKKNQDLEFKIQNLKCVSFILVFCVFCILFVLTQEGYTVSNSSGSGQDTSLLPLKNEALSYFETVTGRVVSVNGNKVKIDIGSLQSVKTGMRLFVFKEGAPFMHPLTREPIGKIELPIGEVEITEVTDRESTGIIIKGMPEDFAKNLDNAKAKVPGTQVRMLFYQGDVDWFLGDSYYHMIRDTGRFELIDTSTEERPLSEIISEAKAKGADVVLMLNSEESGDQITLTQKLLWASDSKIFSEKTVPINIAHVRELRFKAGLFGPKEGEALLTFQLPFGARRLAVGDLDGNGEPEIITASGDMIRVYRPGVDLTLLWELKVPLTGDIIWIDTINLNRKDIMLITSMRDGDITSYIYEIRGSKFEQIYKASGTFIRALNSNIIGQEHSRADGYYGNVFYIEYIDGKHKRGDVLKLPPGVNIYDFQIVSAPDGRQAVLAWDENGFLSLYNEQGVRIWAGEDFGGFPAELTFKRESPTIMRERGTWSVKDRLIIVRNEVLAPKRKPLVDMARGLGYSSSEIRGFWWNGVIVEERAFIEGIGGEILDYALVGDRVVVLSKPLFGIRAGNILKGESPFGTMLYIFSLKGR